MPRVFSTTFFVVVLLCFALPFATVVPSCSSERVTVTGLELATANVPQGDYAGAASSVESNGGPLALAAVAFALAGILLGLARSRVAQLVVATCGLQALHLEFYALWLDASEVDVHHGWVLAALSFAAAGVASVVGIRRTPARAPSHATRIRPAFR